MTNFIFAKDGGLFDFDLTLPFIIFEFLILSFILNKLFYVPVQKIIDNRKAYINKLSNEINLLLKKGETLILKYENILAKEKMNLNLNNLNFNKNCDSSFEEIIKNISNWNLTQIKKSKSVFTYQICSMFESFNTTLKTTEKDIYNYLVN